ncbi:diguanylate cyclase [Sulfurimonas sp. MAG313]|nr:diguanylate cyclase [Sulfurimonas sp. MAG313]MDF1882003.1 diguanylate cyclase [Sulfurimonas sp. MAG313]
MTRDIKIHSMNLLIIDNSANSSLLLKAILKNKGFKNIYFATDVESSYVHLDKQRIDLILLSYVLSGISGTEVCKEISGNMLYEDIPIIMVTVNNDIKTLQVSFENGATDYIAKPFKGEELVARVQAHLIRKQVNDIRKTTAITDPLTNIYNRRHFDTIFEHFHARSISENKAISFFMIDIDNFKPYNDNYGHQKGDVTLIKVAKILEEQLPRTDDYVFRIGGEEFAILLYDTTVGFLLQLSGQIHEALAKENIEHKFNANFNKVSVSIGVFTSLCEHGISKFEIYDRADKALYQSKENGRSQTTFEQG